MSRKLWLTGVAAATVFATAGMGWVTAQEAAVPAVVSPPEEAAPPPSNPNIQTDSSGLPTAPVPYTVLVPQRRQQRAETATAAAPTPEALELEEPGETPPLKPRPRHTAAIVQAIDKVTAETLRFEVEVGKPVRYKTLVFNLRACETQAEDEPAPESAGHLTITSQPKGMPGRVQPEAAQVFRGWMFASSPGLNPFEHPVYDAWLVGCKAPPPPPVPASEGGAAAATPAARAPARPAPRPAPAPEPAVIEDGEGPSQTTASTEATATTPG
jgi:hypothetical protein